MESFKWGTHFLTGIEDVDQQHQALVSMINSFGEAIADDNLETDFLSELFTKLAAYAQTHFETEKQLMTSLQLDPKHITYHLDQHQQFIDEVSYFSDSINPDNPAEYRSLFEYLVHWLAYHILGIDKNMARQVSAIKNGATGAEAFLQQEKEASSATEPLVEALIGLFKLVSSRNRALVELNRTLEMRVAERTEDLSKANQALKIISITDELTQLPNRRFALGQLDLLWTETMKNRQPLAVLMIDADDFKVVNDTYGHDAGDKVLRRLAKELQHSFRSDDIVCRLGGDEFIVICPNTDVEGASHLGELTLSAVTKLKVAVGDGFWHGSVSIGVACTNGKMRNVEALIKSADNAVYAAKKNGRKCVKTMNQ